MIKLTSRKLFHQYRSIGGIVKSKKFSRSNKLMVEIHPFNIIELAELDFVKYVEEVSPIAVPNNIDGGKLSKVFWDNDGNAEGMAEYIDLYSFSIYTISISTSG